MESNPANIAVQSATAQPEQSNPNAADLELLSQEDIKEQHQAAALARASSLLLPYERQLIEDAIQDDCLIITAAGLGWQRIAAALLRVAQNAPASTSPPSTSTSSPPAGRCILVLGASPWQRNLITSELSRHQKHTSPSPSAPHLPPPLDINNEVTASERLQLYREAPGGRPLFITPRILLVDLLARRLTGRQVAGVLVLNAHRASDVSGEGFAVSLLRRDVPRGVMGAGGLWVRAMSDAPTAFNQGFNKVEKVMKALQLRRLHLWPRFHEHVRQVLDEQKPVVVEWEQELTASTATIQAALLEVLEGLMRELRRTNSKLDASELIVENGVLKSFDEIVRRQLDPIWHTVSWKTRRIVTDLRTLRELSSHLLTTDCVTFLAHLEGLRQSEGVRCVWLFHEATHAIYEQARRRVYIYRQQQQNPTTTTATTARGLTGRSGGRSGPAAGGNTAAGTAGGGGGGGGNGGAGISEVEAVLEPPPKWGLLLDVLTEIQRQRAALRGLDGGLEDEKEGEGGKGGSGVEGPRRGDVGVGTTAGTAAAGGEGGGGIEVVDLAFSDSEEEEEDTSGEGKGEDVFRGTGSAPSVSSSLGALLEELGLCRREGESGDGGGGGGGGGGGSGSTSAAAEAGPGSPSGLCLGWGGGGGGPRLTPRDVRLLVAAGCGPVLVVARELHAARLLERVVREGGSAVMLGLYEQYLSSKLQGGAPGGTASSRSEGGGGGRGGRGGGGGGGRGGGGVGGWKRRRGFGAAGDPDEEGRGPVLRPGEHQALLAEAQRLGTEREGGPGASRGGREGKRARTAVQSASAAAAAAGDGGGGRGGGRRARGRGGGGGGRGSSRGGVRQRKPDDSPMRVRAAAVAAEEVDEEEAGEKEGEEEGGTSAGAAGLRTRGIVVGRAGQLGGGGGGGVGSRAERQGEEEEEDDDLIVDEKTGGGTGVRRRRGSGVRQPQRGAAVGGRRGGRGTAAAGAVGHSDGGGPDGGLSGKAVTVSYNGGGAYGTDEDEQEGGFAEPVPPPLSDTGTEGTTPASAAAGGPQPLPTPPLLCDVHFVSLDSHDEFILWRLAPSFIIMHEPDLAFLRQVEVYQAERCQSGGPPLWLHTLCYSNSMEQQRFRAIVERERDTLLRLITAKQHLVLPDPPSAPPPAQGVAGGGGGGGGGGGALSADLWLDVYSANALTRSAGGRAAARGGGGGVGFGGPGGGPGAPRRLVVDVREFMSSLPAVLYQKGFELLPVTLEVGDYVLSPGQVLERKSLPDLHASLASGRLYNQIEAMSRHYTRPLLLIEFDPDRQFGLQSASELGDDIDPKNVISKLVLLTLHFPKLRLLWSRSPQATADMFASLKSNQDDPDPATAALVGLPLGPEGVPLLPAAAGGTAGGPLAGGGGVCGTNHHQPPVVESVVNQPAMELLRRLPGVNDSNYRTILSSVSCLSDLASLPLERLEAVMGSAKAARALKEFLDAPCPRI